MEKNRTGKFVKMGNRFYNIYRSQDWKNNGDYKCLEVNSDSNRNINVSLEHRDTKDFCGTKQIDFSIKREDARNFAETILKELDKPVDIKVVYTGTTQEEYDLIKGKVYKAEIVRQDGEDKAIFRTGNIKVTTPKFVILVED